MSPDSTKQLYGSLQKVFNRKKADGTFFYSNDEVNHILPVIMIYTGIDPTQLNPSAQNMLLNFIHMAGLDFKQDTSDIIHEKISKFWEKHPPRQELLDALNSIQPLFKHAPPLPSQTFLKFTDTYKAPNIAESTPQNKQRSTLVEIQQMNKKTF